MKVNISKNAVKHLILIADDLSNLEGDEPSWNYIAIMKNLLLANKFREENNGLELSSETVDWMFNILDMLVSEHSPSKQRVSGKTRKALKAEMAKQRW